MADLTASRLREVLSYDPDTGVFTWRMTRRGRAVAGKKAGSKNGRGYIIVRVDRLLHRANRLAWLYMTGSWPPGDIDHINGDRADDRWGNLRPATRSQNNANGRRPRDNTSGFKGVSWHRGCNKWQAGIGVGGRRRHLGLFDTPEAAHNSYLTAAAKLFGQFVRAG